MISIDEVKKIELKVAKVLKVEEHPNADRLWVLQVDLGEETPRTIVAGLRKDYSPQELEGKSIVVVSNLEEAVLRGVKSQGMLLAAKDTNTLSILTVDREIAPGSSIG